MVLLGVVAMVQLPIALYPNIAPPEILVQATYVGADALTIEQSVATPDRAQMTGVDNMLYMYSTSTTSGGQMSLRVDVRRQHRSEHRPGAGADALLAGRLPAPAAGDDAGRDRQEVHVEPARPLRALLAEGHATTTLFISNYAYININDPMTRVPGIGQVQIFGAGPVRDALLGAPGHAGQARDHRQRHRQRDPGPEHRQRRRPDRRQPGAAGPAIHLHGAGAGSADIAGGLRRTSWCAPGRTARWCA